MPQSTVLQQTLQIRQTVEGVGLHGGRPVRLTLAPAPVDHGIVFVRTDLAHPVEIPARSGFVVDTLLNTTLGVGHVRIGTVEHLLAALRGGLKTVLIPKENEKDLEEIPDNVKRDLEIIPVSTVDEVLKHALVRLPEAVEWKDPKETTIAPISATTTPPTDEENGIITH